MTEILLWINAYYRESMLLIIWAMILARHFPFFGRR